MSESEVIRNRCALLHPPTHSHTCRQSPESLFEAGGAVSPAGPSSGAMIVWAELVGSFESPSESYTRVCVPAWVTLWIVFALSRLQIALELQHCRNEFSNWSCPLRISIFLNRHSWRGVWKQMSDYWCLDSLFNSLSVNVLWMCVSCMLPNLWLVNKSSRCSK